MGSNVTALAKIKNVLSLERRKVLIKTYVEAQFSYCLLIWMFCSYTLDRKNQPPS